MKLKPLKFENYERRAKYYISKTDDGGLHVKFKLRNLMDTRGPKVSGGVLREQYVLDNLHFHLPSEQMIYGKSYPVEAHFVHYRRSLGSMERAKSSRIAEAVAIISIMYEVYVTECPKTILFEALNRLSLSCCNNIETQFRLRDILPSYLRSYYTYKTSQDSGIFRGGPSTIWITMAVPGILSYWQYSQLTNVMKSKMCSTQEVATKCPRFVINGCFITPEKPRSSPTPGKNAATSYSDSTQPNSYGWMYGMPASSMTYPNVYSNWGVNENTAKE